MTDTLPVVYGPLPADQDTLNIDAEEIVSMVQEN